MHWNCQLHGYNVKSLGCIPADDSKPWYCRMRVGVNTLKNFLPEISEKAGISVRYTNHSLRATAVSRMYENGKLISEKSGHRSLKALRAYERTSKKQEKAAGICIQAEKMFSVTETNNESTEFPKPSTKEHPQLMQFSGLQGCTLNFYNN